MARGKESKIIPSWPWEADRLAVLSMGVHPILFQCNIQGWLKQLLSLLRGNVLLLWQGEQPGVRYSLV